MTYPTAPGQRCRVVGGRLTAERAVQSPNFGKIVITEYLHRAKAGIEQENVWHCRSADNTVLTTFYSAGFYADFLECWLEVIPTETPPPKVLAKKLEQ